MLACMNDILSWWLICCSSDVIFFSSEVDPGMFSDALTCIDLNSLYSNYKRSLVSYKTSIPILPNAL